MKRQAARGVCAGVLVLVMAVCAGDLADEDWVRHPVSVGRRPVHGLVIAPQPNIMLSGLLEFEGSSQPTAVRLVLEAAAGETWLGMPNADSLGDQMAFVMGGVRPGRYVIRSGSGSRHAVMRATLDGRDVTRGLDASELTGRETLVVRVTDKLATVNGTVAAAPNTSGAVYLFPADTNSWSHMGLNPPEFRRGVWQAGQPRHHRPAVRHRFQRGECAGADGAELAIYSLC